MEPQLSQNIRHWINMWRMSMCHQNIVSLLYLSIGTERRSNLRQKISHDDINNLIITKPWNKFEQSFIRLRNITFDRSVFFSKTKEAIQWSIQCSQRICAELGWNNRNNWGHLQKKYFRQRYAKRTNTRQGRDWKNSN